MDETYRRRLADVAARWNIVERRMKEAELLRGETMIATINELRYAGRRLADVLLLLSKDQRTDDDNEVINNHLLIAENYIINADHDLTDATVLYVLLRVRRVIESYGHNKIRTHIPNFAEHVAILEEAQEIVINSRGNREARIFLYDRLASVHVPQLIQLHKRISDVPELQITDRQVRRGLQVVTVLATIGSVASILSFIFAGWVWWTNPTLDDIRTAVQQVLQQKP